MKRSLSVLAATIAGAAAIAPPTSTSPIENIVVIMFENRAFDHLLGHLAMTNPEIDGIPSASARCNPLDPLNPNNKSQVCVNWNVIDEGPDDPCHSFECIAQQVTGYSDAVNATLPPTMDGFAANAISIGGNIPFVFSAYNATNLPVLSTLATEFAVFDRYHVSIPTCTNPNREMMMSGTSHGVIDNNFPKDGFPQQTHFTFLQKRGVSVKIYYNDDPWMAPAFADLRTNESLQFIQEMPNFFWDIGNNTLPRFSLIQPRMATSATGPSNWQHPDNSVEAGEQLLADVYGALRNSSYWTNTLLIINYDEHGGFYDHQVPPQTGIPSPDGILAPNGFGFDRLGIRVPMVLVSPYIAKGTVVHEPTGSQAPTPTSQFEHTSVIASANAIFGIQENLTARDAWAGRFDNLVSGAFTNGKPRDDCPLTLPRALPLSEERLEKERNRLLNDHHLDSLELLCYLESSKLIHPVCTGFSGDKKVRSALLEELAVSAGEAPRSAPTHDGPWAQAEQYPTLYAPIARRLRQRDFEGISKALFSAYRAQVAAEAEAKVAKGVNKKE